MTTTPDWNAALESVRHVQEILSQFNKALDEFITQDAECLSIKRHVAMLARCRDQAPTILITGPSGTGKELIARALHYPAERPFVAVNLAALPDTLYQALLFGHVKGTFTGAYDDKAGAFESAGHGTIFLDEIGDMPLGQQAALLRVLESREVTRVGSFTPLALNCRIIAATNKDLDAEVEAGRFREDLLGRLFGFTVTIPPLSKRTADVVLIAQVYGLPADQAATLYERYFKQIDKYGVRFIKAAAGQWKLFNEIKRIEDSAKPPTLAAAYTNINTMALTQEDKLEMP